MVMGLINVPHDFSTNMSDSLNLMFIHKTIGNEEAYFVANQQNVPLSRECIFRVKGKIPEIWDPQYGTTIKPAIYNIEKNQLRIPVTFKPKESLIFIFRNGNAENYICKVNIGGKQIFPLIELADTMIGVPGATYGNLKYELTSGQAGDYVFSTNKGREFKVSFAKPDTFEIKDFKGSIEFAPVYRASIAPVTITELKPFTSFVNPDIRYFSGTAKYTIYFTLPVNFTSKTDSILLCMGNFEATTEIRLNGQLLDHAWMPGYLLNVGNLLLSDNKLEVIVANTCRNRIIGDFIEYGKVQTVWTSAPVEQYLDKNKFLKPSGLMGPLVLIKVQKQAVGM
jgi:hypothetical protein